MLLKGKHGKISALIPPKPRRALVTLNDTVTYLFYFVLGSPWISLNPTRATVLWTHSPFVLRCSMYFSKTYYHIIYLDQNQIQDFLKFHWQFFFSGNRLCFLRTVWRVRTPGSHSVTANHLYSDPEQTTHASVFRLPNHLKLGKKKARVSSLSHLQQKKEGGKNNFTQQ